MKISSLLFPLLVYLILGCDKDEQSGIRNLCTAEILKAFKMVPYTGQSNYCSSLSLYEFEDNNFYIEDSCIKDLVPNPVDCDNVSYVIIDGKYNENRAQLFFKEATDKGIVGVYE